MSNESHSVPDRATRTLLTLIAAGIWALVALQAWQTTTLRELMAELYAIGAETQAIHEHLEPEGEDDPGHSATYGPGARPDEPRGVRAGLR